MRFVDLSANNAGAPSFKKQKAAGARIVALKATEGGDYDDGRFKPWRTQALNAGLLVWAYHFARPDNNTPGEEVDHFLRRTGGAIRGKQVLVLDYEPPSGGSNRWVQEFCDRARRAGSPIDVMYGGRHLREQQIQRHATGLWLAAYTPSWQPWAPPAWPRGAVIAWQYTEAGSFPGVTGRCDVNLWLGSDAVLNRMLGGREDPLEFLSAGERELVVKLGELRTDVARAGGWAKNPKRKALADELKEQLAGRINRVEDLDPNEENRRERLNLMRDARAGRRLKI